ncbi:hypothetical protein SteCoe_26589 [Stentor coeruleus]|uniref:Uncharacterized protein n=1 Tax=Stentor coeruleus TaxID=5963 RepID=A0A1R2BCG6_9CILI|nr:hypothetical protein SteCoe_26589 [Stentor coeruleus]
MNHHSRQKFKNYSLDISSIPRRQYESPYYKQGSTKQPKPQVLYKSYNSSVSPSTKVFACHRPNSKSLSTSSSDFFSVLVSHMRRLDENFSLDLVEETPLTQALNCLIQAIDIIEQERGQGNANITEESDNYNENDKKTSKLEALLKAKEDKLIIAEAALAREKKALAREKENVKKMKEYYKKQEYEIQMQKAEIEIRERENDEKICCIKQRLEIENKEVEDKKREVEKDTIEVAAMKKKLEEFSSSLMEEREELEIERSKLFEKTLEIDKEIWKIESEKIILEEKQAMNNHLKAKIDEEMIQIETDRAELLKSKINLQSDVIKHTELLTNLESERISLSELQESLATEKFILSEEKSKLNQKEERISNILSQLDEEKHKILLDQPLSIIKNPFIQSNSLLSNSSDAKDPTFFLTKIESPKDKFISIEMLEELQNQMFSYSQEVENREKALENRSQTLSKKEKDLENKLIEVQALESSLLKAKNNLEEVSFSTIPKLETESQNIQYILADLQAKKSEIDLGYSQLQERILEFEKSKNDSFKSPDVNKLMQKIDKKNKKLQQREESLAQFEAQLQQEKDENLAHALFLQRAQKDFELEYTQKQAEIQLATKKLERLQAKLDDIISLINTKENQLLNLKSHLIQEKSKLPSLDYNNIKNSAN